MVANPDSWSGFPKVRRVTLQATGVAEFGKYRAIGHAKHGVANCCAFSTLHAARCTLHAARRTLHAARCTLHAARRTLHAGLLFAARRPRQLRVVDGSRVNLITPGRVTRNQHERISC